MAQALDVPVVAEGIEDAAAHETLLQMGCASGQGWYFGKPMPAEDAKHLLRHSQALPSQATPSLSTAQRG
jgi:EAL domain-containing protein (putative c-di-GMP-specific phosphodiesterase class I)